MYDPNADNFDPEVERVVSGDPEALVLIGFEESAQILTTLFESGFTADQKSDLLRRRQRRQRPRRAAARRARWSASRARCPQAELTEDFRTRLLEVDPALIDFSYGPETYDAIVISALAAELAGTDDPAPIAARDQRRHPRRHEVHDVRGLHGADRGRRRTSTTTARPVR